MSSSRLEASYSLAQNRYAELGGDTEAALQMLASIPISLHCWQGDDVGGFETQGTALSGGIAVTGNYPGKARTAEELRADVGKALSLIPGKHRFNLHAIYGEFDGQNIERNEIEPKHFSGWIAWAKEVGLGLDFNPTFFSHPLANGGFTLSHSDPSIRRFWIEHGIACRRIGATMGQSLGSACVTNVWIPDGMKDTPVDRLGPRERLLESLDAVFAEPLDPKHNLDAVEGKLFGIGSESYVVGSHEFYLGYAITRKKLLCLDAGHFHPTESLADKLSAVLLHLDQVLLHASRGIRWDSDHVVTLTDDLLALAQEVVFGQFLSRVRMGLDFFDASINRIAAWVIGSRAMFKALLLALLQPLTSLRDAELNHDYTKRLAWLEEQKTLPFGAVWDMFCLRQDVPVGSAWLNDVKQYEKDVLSRRDT
jgi:L-rhamnose isomerase